MQRNRFFTLVVLAGMIVAFSASSYAAGRDYKKLKKVVRSYSLRGPLEKVIPQLEKFGGVSIVVDWPALKAAGVEKTEDVQLCGTNEEFIDIVDLLLAQVGKRGKPLAWRQMKPKVLLITTQSNVIRRRLGPPEHSRLAEKPSPCRTPKHGPAVFRFENTRLEDVLEALRQGAGVNLFVNWTSLKGVGVTRDTPVTFRAKEISTARALDLVMLNLNGRKDRYSSVYWVVDKGLVRVDTGEVLDTIMRTRVEDVTDLLRITPNFRGPRMQLSAIGNVSTDNKNNSSKNDADVWEDLDDDNDEPDRESPAEMRAYQKNQLIESIKNSIGPEMWYPNGKGTITLFRNQLVITQSLLGWTLMERGNR